MSGRRVLYKNKYLILDGYNVINQWPDLKAIAQVNLEEARDRLLEEVVNYVAYTGESAYLVFDAYLVKSTIHKQIVDRGVNVVYTREHQTADSFIEIMVSKLSEDRKNFIRVVTSDWAEQQVVLGSGAIRFSPWELKEDLARVKSKIREKYEKKPVQTNTLADLLDGDLFEKLEKWRKE